MLTGTQSAFVVNLAASFLADRPKQSVSDWCCENLAFNEPKNNGPFNLAGREYTREILDCWADPAITDMVQIFGSQAGKTASIQGGAAWTIVNSPARFLWVMPTRDLCRDFSRNRWMTLLRASSVFNGLIPSGLKRYDFSTLQQLVGSALVGFAWSNSPTALSSNPCDVVILDEVDKFNEGGKEADAVNLADQRTKNTANPKRIKTTTPTLVDGLGWREFLKTDQRRRFVPCPHCSKLVVLIWSKAYTVFRSTGHEAEVRWDSEAKRKDGSWDLDRVERSARFQCPHCGGHILDAHKTRMDRAGEWRATPDALRLKLDQASTAARGYRGWHLPSLYASAKETNVGRLAVKFLQSKASLEGLQGFINGDLAEPYESQDTRSERIELVTERIVDPNGKSKILSVDVQSESPRFWFVVLVFAPGQVHTIDAGSLDSWEEVEDKQNSHGIDNVGVCVDSGDNTKRKEDSVYINCAHHCFAVPRVDSLPELIGWVPCKGMPVDKRWRDKKTGLLLPYRMQPIDPFEQTSYAESSSIGLFEFAGSYFKDIFDAMRRGRGDVVWSVEKSVATDEFWHHLDSEYKGTFYNKKTRRAEHGWIKRGRHWPNHMLDCMVQGFAFAARMGVLRVGRSQQYERGSGGE